MIFYTSETTFQIVILSMLETIVLMKVLIINIITVWYLTESHIKLKRDCRIDYLIFFKKSTQTDASIQKFFLPWYYSEEFQSA